MLLTDDPPQQASRLRRRIGASARNAEERRALLTTLALFSPMLDEAGVRRRLQDAGDRLKSVGAGLLEAVCMDPSFREQERSALLALIRDAVRADARRRKVGLQEIQSAMDGADAWVDDIVRRASPPPKRPRRIAA